MKLLKNILWFIPNIKRLHSIDAVLDNHQGGIAKRLDEEVELLEFLREKCPSLLEDNPWVEGWIESNHHFLSDLASAAEKTDSFRPNRMRPFPRPWPGRA
jgi:hypothetical protein